LLVSDFDFELPKELIAQEALPDRASSRMLHLSRAYGSLRDRWFRDFPDLLRPTDLVVFNNSKVIPARLFGRRLGVPAKKSAVLPSGKIEVLLLRQILQQPNQWNCLIRAGGKVDVGERLVLGEPDSSGEALCATVIGRGVSGERAIEFDPVPDFFSRLDHIGHMPLPPYIAREDRPEDRERYQTVFARERGSVAAPTAGLHFTPEILARLDERGIERTTVTLHVGLGTFQPIRVDRVEEHKLHREVYSISQDAAESINRAREQGRRVVAVGTTTVRTLEHAASSNVISAGDGEADIFIYPGYEFKVVSGLLTNFHLPKSSLLMMVCALAGKEHVMSAYRHAVAEAYRFYSYGDCMFLE